eukprot:gene19920-21872_t
MLSFEEIGEPISMYQQSFNLSDFILGPFEEEISKENFSAMLKREQEDATNETFMDEDDYQISTLDVASDTSPMEPKAQYNAYSGYQCQQTEPTSPSGLSECSSTSSSTLGTFQPLSSVYNGCAVNRNSILPANSNLYATYVTRERGHPGRKPRLRDEQLPIEEREKRRVRRERNKLAALRCRTRRRERIEVLEKETDDLEGENNKVRSDISCLRAQLKQLEEMLKEHNCEKNI